MITTTWIAPSADVLGQGGADVRTSGSTMSGSAAPSQATGLSAAACRRTAPSAAPLAATGLDVFGRDVFGLGALGVTPVAVKRRVLAPIAERSIAPTYLNTQDGTTLGIHSPGRPQS